MQVEHHVALAAVQAQEGPALAVTHRAQAATVVAEVRFDLDDVGTQVTQEGGPVGTREHGRHVENTDAVERLAGRVCFGHVTAPGGS